MLAAVRYANDPRGALRIEERPVPQPRPGDVLLKVRACGVCRTDLHIVDAELPAHCDAVVPGHQIVGEIVEVGEGVDGAMKGRRAGISWMGGVDGVCDQCRAGRENLCDHPVFTGYDRDGGYAQFVTARAAFTIALPAALDDVRAAPLLCAGIIGFRTVRVAGVEPGERVGLFGFGASAHLVLQVLRVWGCPVYVSSRGEEHRKFARSMGATWVGDALERPPVALDRALTFAPSGDVVVSALASIRKGGVVAINAIHLDRMPEFDYDSLLWGERQLRSVTNMTRADARDFLELAASEGIAAHATEFALDDAAAALDAVRSDGLDGAAVIRP